MGRYILASVVSFFLWILITPPLVIPQMDAKALFEAKCGVCHELDRPTSKKKSKEEWEKTVVRMKAKPKASISDEEAKIITDYLATHYGK
ncbi:MAG: photosystem P840 reaction-center cytochrome c-551 [Syntrophobacterales bacterium]|nr:photosystem P840 reaction-center cytochrome c-551 [Syntrophobacterales bacterium]